MDIFRSHERSEYSYIELGDFDFFCGKNFVHAGNLFTRKKASIINFSWNSKSLEVIPFSLKLES